MTIGFLEAFSFSKQITIRAGSVKSCTNQNWKWLTQNASAK